MKTRYLILTILIALVLITGGILGYRFYKDNQTKPSPASNTQQEQAPQNPDTSKTSNTQSYPVSIYFSKRPDSDNDPSKVFPVSRNSPDLGTGKYSITELLKGPSKQEQAEGYFTTVRLRLDDSNCNNQDFTFNIQDSIATLRFCRNFDHLGVVADGQAESSIKATLNQFSTVKKVVILNKDNECEFDLSGMNLCLQ